MSSYYGNINGLSKKRDSLNMIRNEHNPHIVCLFKTKLSHNNKIKIPVYYIFKESKNALSGGIIIVVKEEISSKWIEATEIENNWILWRRIDTQNVVTTITSVHGPQENDLFEEKTKLYDDVIVEIQRACTRSPYVLIIGDFNTKLKSNLQNVSQNGKLFEHMINDFNMKIANTLPICKDQWSRANNKNSSVRSIIDYLLLSEKLEPNFRKLLIVESKPIYPYKVTNDKKTYSDHNAFIFSMQMKINNSNKKKNNCNKN